MSQNLYSAAMSVDGFIAGRRGDMSWLADYLGPNPVVDDLIERTGALLVGNRTFRGDDPYQGTPGEGEAFGGGWSGPQFVLTHNLPDEPVPGVTFVDNLDDALSLARGAAKEKYVNVLGASVASQCLAAGALDEVLVSVVPVLLGDGIRLFDHLDGGAVKLDPISVTTAPQATNLWLRVVR
jgi:dihydrofolate reductase